MSQAMEAKAMKYFFFFLNNYRVGLSVIYLLNYDGTQNFSLSTVRKSEEAFVEDVRKVFKKDRGIEIPPEYLTGLFHREGKHTFVVENGDYFRKPTIATEVVNPQYVVIEEMVEDGYEGQAIGIVSS